jgi:hypothetical protein
MGSISAMVAVPVAAQDAVETESLEEQLADLEARIGQYKAEHDPNAPLTEARAAEVRALVQDVLEDADTRMSLLDPPTSGWDGHPFLASPSGDLLLEVEGRFQWRYVYNRQDHEPTVFDHDSSRSGFENRRIRYIFSGHVLDPSITYKLQATYNRDGGELELEDAYVQKECDNGWHVLAGQARPPFTREVIVSTFRQTAVERAIAHGAIEVSRTQGIEIGWTGDKFGVRAMYHDGDEQANTPALMYDTEYALSARGELLAAGEWGQFNDFTSWRGGDFGLLFGVGGHFERSEYGTAIEEFEDCRWTADASAEFGGSHLYGAVGQRHIEPVSGGDDLDILIALAQGGFFITDTCELFGRFEWGDDDSDDQLMILTVGGTKFWNKHNLKWTTDLGYAFEAVTPIFASSGAGWRIDPPGADSQIVIRSQFQLMF